MKQISITNARFAPSLLQSRTSPSNVDTIFVGNVVTAYSVLVKQSAPRVVNQTHLQMLYLKNIFNELSKVLKYAARITRKGVSGSVGAVYRRPWAYWVVLLCDNSERVVVTTVLTWDLSTAVKKTSETRQATNTSSLSRIKVVIEVSQLTDPLTPFLVIRAAYFKTFDNSLKIFFKYSICKCVWFTTRGALCFTNTE